MIEDVGVDQTVPSILKADRQVHGHYIHPLPFVVPDGVPVETENQSTVSNPGSR